MTPLQGRSMREVENRCPRGVATIPNCVSCTLPSSQSSVALDENRPCWPLPLAFYLSYQCRVLGGGVRVLPGPGEKATHYLVLSSLILHTHTQNAVSGAWGAAPGAHPWCPFSRRRSATHCQVGQIS